MIDETQTSTFPFVAGDAAGDNRLILASRVEGTPVFDEAGERIGKVSDISIQRLTGKAVYGIMSFGGFLGIGEKFHPLPWSMLTYDPAQGGFVVPLDQAALQNAPYYDRAELEKLGGEHRDFEASIYAYYGRYGVVPYW